MPVFYFYFSDLRVLSTKKAPKLEALKNPFDLMIDNLLAFIRFMGRPIKGLRAHTDFDKDGYLSVCLKSVFEERSGKCWQTPHQSIKEYACQLD